MSNLKSRLQELNDLTEEKNKLFLRIKENPKLQHKLQKDIATINSKMALLRDKNEYNRTKAFIFVVRGMLSKEDYLEAWKRVDDILNDIHKNVFQDPEILNDLQ